MEYGTEGQAVGCLENLIIAGSTNGERIAIMGGRLGWECHLSIFFTIIPNVFDERMDFNSYQGMR